MSLTKTRDVQWFDSAACAGMDPEIFYPKLDGKWPKRKEAQARATCAGCPVRIECIDYAVAQRWDEIGYWGSTQSERRKIRSLFEFPEPHIIDDYAEELVSLIHEG